MKITIISDTHGLHEDIGLLKGDVLIHCGDLCDHTLKTRYELDRIDDWFAQQDFDLILCIGGNHDFFLDMQRRKGQLFSFSHAVYLEDEAFEHDGIRFYGSPWIPDLLGWAFYMDNPSLIKRWSLIPDDVDILITHTPPRLILDQPRSKYSHLGCPYLAKRVQAIQPRLHCFGHIHASYGVHETPDTTYVNASMASSQGRLLSIKNKPIEYAIS